MSDETHQLRQRVSQLESDIRVLRTALAEAQAKEPKAPEATEAPKKRGRPAKAKE